MQDSIVLVVLMVKLHVHLILFVLLMYPHSQAVLQAKPHQRVQSAKQLVRNHCVQMRLLIHLNAAYVLVVLLLL